jgi:hypothetical protein
MCLKTQHGKYKFADRVFEWVNHDLRKFCDKTWYAGKEAKIIRTAMMLPEKVRSRERAAYSTANTGTAERSDYGAGVVKKMACTDVFAHGLLWCCTHQIWRDGAPLLDDKGVAVERGVLTRLSDRQPLNGALPGLLHTAMDRLTFSAETFEFTEEARLSSKRKGESGLFATLAPTTAAQEEYRAFIVARATTTNARIIEEMKYKTQLLFNIKALGDEIKEHMRNKVSNAPSPDELESAMASNDKRGLLAGLLADSRREWFRTHPPTQPPADAFCTLDSWPKIKRGSLDVDACAHPFVSLVGGAMPTYNKKHFPSADAQPTAQAPPPPVVASTFLGQMAAYAMPLFL